MPGYPVLERSHSFCHLRVRSSDGHLVTVKFILNNSIIHAVLNGNRRDGIPAKPLLVISVYKVPICHASKGRWTILPLILLRLSQPTCYWCENRGWCIKQVVITTTFSPVSMVIDCPAHKKRTHRPNAVTEFLSVITLLHFAQTPYRLPSPAR